MTLRLTGPQQTVLGDMQPDGRVYRGKHNEVCAELRRLGFVVYDPQPSQYSTEHPERAAWRVTDAGRAAIGERGSR